MKDDARSEVITTMEDLCDLMQLVRAMTKADRGSEAFLTVACDLARVETNPVKALNYNLATEMIMATLEESPISEEAKESIYRIFGGEDQEY